MAANRKTAWQKARHPDDPPGHQSVLDNITRKGTGPGVPENEIDPIDCREARRDILAQQNDSCLGYVAHPPARPACSVAKVCPWEFCPCGARIRLGLAPA